MGRIALILALLTTVAARPAAADVVLINVFEVPDGRLEQVIAAWRDARAFLRAQPGYIDTALHRSVHGDDRFALINVARWESAESFRAAIAAMRAAGVFPDIPGLGVNPALYRVIAADTDPTP